MANIVVQQISKSGIAPSFVAAAAGGDTPANDGQTLVHVKNGGASSVNVTINSVEKCNHGFDHDVIVAVPAGSERIIGPFEPKRFNNENGRLNITYSAVTSVTVAAFRM